MKVKPNPYIITFHKEAEDGPEHLLHMLIGYGVLLKKNGEPVCEGVIERVSLDMVTLARFCEHCGRTNIEALRSFDIFEDFDEVMYL